MQKVLFNALLAVIIGVVFTSQAMATGYTDLAKDHWAYKYVTQLTKEHVLYGYPDGAFKPDELATRAEFATMVVKSLHQQDHQIKDIIEFSDITKDYWAWDMVQRAVTLDLVKATKDNKFRPEDSVTRAEAIAVAINALTTENISSLKAKEVLATVYSDYDLIPEWFLITAGKAQILGLVTKLPASPKQLNATQPATRADLAVLLFKMREEAKLNPNAKLREAMRPKATEGTVLKGVKLDGYIATLPAGTKIPLNFVKEVTTQKTKTGEVVVAKTPDNLITEEKYLIFAKGCEVNANVLDVKRALYFIRNGKLIVNSKSIKTVRQAQTAAFVGMFEDNSAVKGFWQKLCRAVIKGHKIKFEPDVTATLELLKPVKVDLTNGWIIE